MVKQIIWTFKAQNDRKTIFEYWNNRNKSKNYSKKLNQLLVESLNIIAIRPFIGKKTEMKNVRTKIIRDYMIFYEITEKYIVVLTIWDCRQNPVKNKYIS
jgi:addiction module RelE/StbE family toxin